MLKVTATVRTTSNLRLWVMTQADSAVWGRSASGGFSAVWDDIVVWHDAGIGRCRQTARGTSTDREK